MRLDRTIAVSLAKLTSLNDTYRIAILMYHSISNRREAVKHPYYNTITTPERFAEHMKWIKEANAEVVPLDSWDQAFNQQQTLRVVITFDDGFDDFGTHAFPILQAYGYRATMFLPTGFIGTGRELLPGVKHMTWQDIRRLDREGISFGSHTVNHKHLDTLTKHEINNEIRFSAEDIQEHLGKPVTGFSCPFAFPQAHPHIVDALRESLDRYGYKTGVTTKIGTVSLCDDPFTLKRLPVNNDDDKKLFMAKLYGGYNWLHGVQRAMRGVKKILHR
jgi:peptidoglycan/xylan/chitin deacetylase (PgdA/CDA1 family)